MICKSISRCRCLEMQKNISEYKILKDFVDQTRKDIEIECSHKFRYEKILELKMFYSRWTSAHQTGIDKINY